MEQLIRAIGLPYDDRGEGARTSDIPGPWEGKCLWERARVSRMLVADILGEDGVEGCYNRSLISAEAIQAICDGTFADLQRTMQKQGKKVTGMLHEFSRAPVNVEDPRTAELSVRDQLLRDVPLGLQRRTGKDDICKRTRLQPVYRGAVLSPKTDAGEMLFTPAASQRKVLAWATWAESLLPQADSRTRRNDVSVRQILKTVGQISLDQGIDRRSLEQAANRILLFDTLNADPESPGAASILFTQLCTEWVRKQYEWILLYRHKGLQVFEQRRGGPLSVPQGNNDASLHFFHRRGLRDIGTRLSPVLAERELPGGAGKAAETVRIRSTEGWMLGKLSTVQQASKEIDAANQQKITW
ncbi:MAG: hypothetical protein PHO54_04980 [Candidatus Peribacteraceae bacterium]|nr:hypothetical protein [Candidatus Peribacteraceae bacterium]